MDPNDFKAVLSGVTDKAYHLEAPKEEKGEYAIWQEAGTSSLYADNERCETVRMFLVEVYTGKESSELLEKIIEALEENDIAFREQGSHFDPYTKKIRHIIECEAV